MELIRTLQLKAALAVSRLRREPDGQALVEYALLVALIAIVSIGVLTLLGHNVSTIYSKIAHNV